MSALDLGLDTGKLSFSIRISLTVPSSGCHSLPPLPHLGTGHQALAGEAQSLGSNPSCTSC